MRDSVARGQRDQQGHTDLHRQLEACLCENHIYETECFPMVSRRLWFLWWICPPVACPHPIPHMLTCCRRSCFGFNATLYDHVLTEETRTEWSLSTFHSAAQVEVGSVCLCSEQHAVRFHISCLNAIVVHATLMFGIRIKKVNGNYGSLPEK